MFGGTFYNVTFFGDRGVGKSSLINGSNDENIPLIHSEFVIRKFSVNGEEVKLRIEEFDVNTLKVILTLGAPAFSAAKCFVIVCDITSKEAVVSLEFWLEKINANTGNNAQKIPLVVIGNKIDKQGKIEAINAGVQAWCQKQNAKFFMINARELIEIERTFLEICKVIQKPNMDRTKPRSNSRVSSQREDKSRIESPISLDSSSGSKPYKYSLIVVGKVSTGKTLLSRRLVGDPNTVVQPTVNGDTFSKITEHKGKKIELQIWDTAGQETFKSVQKSYYQKADCCLIVYDATDRNLLGSFDNINEYLESIKEISGENVPIILVGNKIDIQDRPSEIAARMSKWCKDNNISEHYEVSALTDKNIDALSIAILDQCYSRMPKSNSDAKKRVHDSNQVVQLSSVNPDRKSWLSNLLEYLGQKC